MKRMPFYGMIKAGVWLFKAEKVFRAWCKMQKDGDYTMEFSKTTCPKTNQQLGYFHAVIVPTAFRQMIADGNRSIMVHINDKFKELPLTEEVVVQMLKQVWATNTGRDVKSKADMTIEECSELIDISIQWCAQYLGCVIPPPEKTLTADWKEPNDS